MSDSTTPEYSLPDYIQHYAFDMDIHEVCIYCGRRCKHRWMRWDGQLPPEEFCGNYIEDPIWKAIFQILDELDNALDSIKWGPEE